MKMITGCNGFIGSHFKEREEKYIGVEAFNAVHMIENFPKWDDIDEIIHMGAISSTVETDLNKLHFYNVDLTLRLFEQAIKYNIPVKYASSASVYGNGSAGWGDLNPLNYYAITKLQVDYWVQDNIDRFSNIQGFRFFNVYGPGEEAKGDQRSPISKFTEQAKMTGEIKVFEDSRKMSRDFVCVNDVVDVVLNSNNPSGIYDLGSGDSIDFYTVAEIIADKEGANIKEIPFPKHLEGKYQYNTESNMSWSNHNFITVHEYVNNS